MTIKMWSFAVHQEMKVEHLEVGNGEILLKEISKCLPNPNPKPFHIKRI
jgi:hypothetical protein